MSERIEAGAQEIADAAPKVAADVSQTVEAGAKQVEENARPAADAASEIIEGSAKKVCDKVQLRSVCKMVS